MRRRVAHRACAGEHFARLTYMAVVMTSEASGPVTVSDVVWIGRPVYHHGWKNIPVVNRNDGIGGLIDLSLLTFENIREMFGIILFDRLAYFVTELLLPIIVLN